MPQFDPTYFTSQIFWLLVCFFILIGFMKVVIVPRLKESLQKRSDYIGMMKNKEESYRLEINELMDKIQTLKIEEDHRAKQLLDQIHHKINREKEAQLTELHQKLAKKQQEMDDQFDTELRALRDNMPTLAQELSEQILTQLIEHDKEKAKKHALN